MKFIRNLFKIKVNEPMPELNISAVPKYTNTYEWVKIKDEMPPHEVVLATWNSYDCGWIIHTVWWYENKQCWMTTGEESVESYFPYTHWRKLPPPPDEENL